jgi:hypothetical protein
LFLQSTLDVHHIDSCINYIKSLSSFKNFDISLFPKKTIQNETFQFAIIKKFPESIDLFYSKPQDILLFLEQNKNQPILLFRLWEHFSKKKYFFENENTIKKNQNSYFVEMSRFLLEHITEFKYQALTNPQNNFQEKIDQSFLDIKELEIEHKKNLMIIQKKIQGYKKIIAFYEKNFFHNEENIVCFFPLSIQSIQALKLFNPLIFQKDSVLNFLFVNKICLDELLDKFPLQIPKHIQNSLFNALLFENLNTDPKENHKILRKRISFLTQTSCMNEKDLIAILDYLQQSQKSKKLFEPFILQEFIKQNPIFIQNPNIFEHFFPLNPLFLFSKIPENQKQNENFYIDYLFALKKEENKNNISSVEFSQYKNMIFSPDFVNIVVQAQNQSLISLATSFFDFFQIENCPISFKTHAPYLLNALQKKEIDNLSHKEFLLTFQKLQLSQNDYISLFQSPNACDLLSIHKGAIYSLLPSKLKNNYFISLQYIQSVHQSTRQYISHHAELTSSFKNIPQQFLKDPYFISEAFKIEPFCITFADPLLWNNPQFIINILHSFDSSYDTPKERETYLSYFPENIQNFFSKHKIERNYADSFYSLMMKAQLSQELQPKIKTKSLKL